MDIRQFQAVYEVARHGSISRAAEAMYVTQQSLSGSVKTLEDELGFQLFKRTAKGSVLTPEGETFLEDVMPVIAEYESAMKKVERIKVGNKRYVRVATAMGIQEIFGYKFNLNLLHAMNDNYSISGFTGYEYPDKQLEEMMRDGLIDLAISGPPLSYPNLEYNKLYTGRLCVFMHKDHPLASKRSLRYSDLRNENFVTLVQGTKIYDRIIDSCKKVGFHPHIILETSNSLFINWRLHNKDCVYIGADITPKYKDIVSVPLDDENNKCNICLVYSKKAFKDKKMRELLKIYSEFLKNNLDDIRRAKDSGEDNFEEHWMIQEKQV
ncbi:MAG: LysR family transcriptional regulator [Firmicutes bacterium]|nr:LysR family transcriptional regulator [Bacillota bacterium]